MLVYEWICTLQFLRFAVGLLVQSSLVSLFDVFDLRSLSTKWASHRKQIVWNIFRLWRILLCWYIKPCMLLNQVCHVCVRFGEWVLTSKAMKRLLQAKGDYFGDWVFAQLSTSKFYSPRCLSNRVGQRDKGERSHGFTFERWSWPSWGIVEWTRTRRYGQDRNRESKLRKRICWPREHRREKGTQVNGER